MARKTTGVTQTANGRWIARYRDLDRKPRSKTFDRQSDAVAWRVEQQAAMRAGTWSSPDHGKVTVEQYAEQWLEGAGHRQRTRELYARRLRNHVYPAFGKRPMRDLRHSQMRAWLSALEREYQPWTVYGIHSMFRTICKCAVADKVRPDSPFAGIKLKTVKSPAVVPMSSEQVGRLCAAAPPRYRALFVLAAATGMRAGELLGLELGCVDFLRRTVRVERQLVQYRPEKAGSLTFALGPPKTETSRRVVEVPQYALNELARHLQQWPATEISLPVVDTAGVKHRSAVLLFTTRTGAPIRMSGLASTWHRSVQRAGLPPARGGLHALRHHVASLLIEAGESVKVVQAQLGHATASETWDTYAHLFPSKEGAVRGVLEQAWDAATVSAARRDTGP